METTKKILLVLSIPLIIIGGIAYMTIRHFVESYRAKRGVCINCNGKYGDVEPGSYQCIRCIQSYNQLNLEVWNKQKKDENKLKPTEKQ